MVGDVWGSRDGVNGWLFSPRRLLFVWEEGLINELTTVLQTFRGVQAEDVWWWNPEKGGIFWLNIHIMCYWRGWFWGWI